MKAVFALLAGLTFGGCKPASLENRPCDWATSPTGSPTGRCSEAAHFTCCRTLNTCIADDDPAPSYCTADVDPMTVVEDWTKLTSNRPVPMEDFTVFAVAQFPFKNAANTKTLDRVLQVAPDLVLRGWGQWKTNGTNDDDFDGSFLPVLHAHDPPIRFMGGGTVSAIFAEQFTSGNLPCPSLKNCASLNWDGDPVSHDELNPGERRGSLANPHFRDYLTALADHQIIEGVDGLMFSELNADMLGQEVDDGTGSSTYDDNEGYDDYHVADFTDFLLGKVFKDDSDETLASLGLPADNRLRRDLLPLRLYARGEGHNFNYRDYRKNNGQAFLNQWGLAKPDNLPAHAAPSQWGAPGTAASFTEIATAYHYWPKLVEALRQKAQSHRGSLGSILMSANGIFPSVDFVSLNLYDEEGHPWQRNKLFPFPGGHLDGATTKVKDFANILVWAAHTAPDAPVVLYLDGRWNTYHSKFTVAERRDFWRIYAAEAYASGLFFAFLIDPPDVSDGALPNASDDGTLDTITELARFYRGHKAMYHGVAAKEEPGLEVSAADVTVTVQATPSGQRFLHFINHNYIEVPHPNSGLQVQENLGVSVPAAAAPSRVRLSTPDAAPDAVASETPDLDLSYSFDSALGVIRFTLPRLEAYDVVTIIPSSSTP